MAVPSMLMVAPSGTANEYTFLGSPSLAAHSIVTGKVAAELLVTKPVTKASFAPIIKRPMLKPPIVLTQISRYQIAT
jgi:hypothetical protein